MRRLILLFAVALPLALSAPQDAGADEEIQVGMASWYGAELAGNATASGEVFSPAKLTAAHPSLPLGTKVRVKNLENGRTVVVRINDRGPFAKNRIIDLSEKAARQLDMIDDGVARVRVVPLES
ncbi:septal ring lytic transglycosylase RlpA family protein [Caenispirillum salinarum]|uniref:septal ring lytic transglycosylase RlpA family protein n=1 Tax=Caenispirillum salinarum TaxID=859058 RepID=UPI00384CE681